MTRLAIILLLGLAWGARAHVGSPNVFFEGQAGPYPIRVILRPPAVLPGLAQVDVRVAGAAKVFLQAALWEAGRDAAPAPVSAEAVAGESSLFHAALWLGQGGSYSVHVAVEGRAGKIQTVAAFLPGILQWIIHPLNMAVEIVRLIHGHVGAPSGQRQHF